MSKTDAVFPFQVQNISGNILLIWIAVKKKGAPFYEIKIVPYLSFLKEVKETAPLFLY
jgi:hypothetical protein